MNVYQWYTYCASIRISCHLVVVHTRVLTAYYSGDDRKLQAKMVTQSSLESFSHAIESIKDYKEQFVFYCTTHQIPDARQKALFLTQIGHYAFAKLKTLHYSTTSH